jgi:hypothetical protein
LTFIKGRLDAMNQTWWTAHAQSAALLLLITLALLGDSSSMLLTTAHAVGARSPASGRCSRSTAERLGAGLWYEPVSGEEVTITLDGSYDGDHFCGVLAASATLTLPAGAEAEWLCLTVHAGGEDACGAGYDLKWTCLTLQSLGTGACADLGPGPATGQDTFVLESPGQLQSCAGVEVDMRGFFTAEVSISSRCG